MALIALWCSLGLIGGLFFVPSILYYPVQLRKDIKEICTKGHRSSAEGHGRIGGFCAAGCFSVLTLWIPALMQWPFFGTEWSCFLYVFAVLASAAWLLYCAQFYVDEDREKIAYRSINLVRFVSPLVIITLIVYRRCFYIWSLEKVKRAREEAKRAEWIKRGWCEKCGGTGRSISYTSGDYDYKKECVNCGHVMVATYSESYYRKQEEQRAREAEQRKRDNEYEQRKQQWERERELNRIMRDGDRADKYMKEQNKWY